ncbi:MAG: HAD family hydrolase [bacterium]|nr:HAD family hydrolase [Candidatus Kapabacteria bacterium]
MVSVVTVDFWNTLFDSTGGEPRNAQRRRALLDAIRGAGNECDDARFDDVFRGIWQYFDEQWLEQQRTPTSREMIDEMLNRLDVALDESVRESIASTFSAGVLEHPPQLFPGASDALKELKALGVRLALISDTAFSPGVILRELMEQCGVGQYFDEYVFSDETGVAKPHPEAFRRALEPFGVSPDDACHIGDIERTDIRGAKAAGMRAVLFRGDPSPSKYAEDQTQADATISHWDEVLAAIKQLS